MQARRTFLTGLGGAALVSGVSPLMTSGFTKEKKIMLKGSYTHYMPEEAEPHLRTFMQWPVNRNIYSDHIFLSMLQNSIADVANAIADFEPVVMLMDKRFEKTARKKLSKNVEIWDVATDDLWCRDSGPVFVNKENYVHTPHVQAIRHLNFNAWGNKQPHENDGKIALKIAERLNLHMLDNGLVGEAGGVESNGAGTLIAHESSWLNKNRNKGSKQEVSEKLLEALGARKIIWAPGIKGADITDYHIDALARFVDEQTVLIQLPETVDKRDPWSVSAYETYEILKNAKNAKGQDLKLLILPEPYDTRITADDFVASYVNYYVCNGAVIMPQFGDKQADQEAFDVLSKAYPERQVVALNIDPIGEVGGGIHCATQQQPSV